MTRGAFSTHSYRKNLTSVSLYILSNPGPPGSSPMEVQKEEMEISAGVDQRSDRGYREVGLTRTSA